MSRASRLLDLIQILRRHRNPVAGSELARELGISVRTLYRDIVTLQAQGAPIAGEAGIGYILKPGYLLPPLNFTEEEIEALALGADWVEKRGDPALALAARQALAKIAAVMPAGRQGEVEATTLFVPPPSFLAVAAPEAHLLRTAIRAGRKVRMRYRDLQEAETERVIWPFAITYLDRVQMLIAHCELRQDFRNFRLDRVISAETLAERLPRSRHVLLAEWKAMMRERYHADIN